MATKRMNRRLLNYLPYFFITIKKVHSLHIAQKSGKTFENLQVYTVLTRVYSVFFPARTSYKRKEWIAFRYSLWMTPDRSAQRSPRTVPPGLPQGRGRPHSSGQRLQMLEALEIIPILQSSQCKCNKDWSMQNSEKHIGRILLYDSPPPQRICRRNANWILFIFYSSYSKTRRTVKISNSSNRPIPGDIQLILQNWILILIIKWKTATSLISLEFWFLVILQEILILFNVLLLLLIKGYYLFYYWLCPASVGRNHSKILRDVKNQF